MALDDSIDALERRFERAKWFFSKGDYTRAKRAAEMLIPHANSSGFSKEELEEIIDFEPPQKKNNRFLYAVMGVGAGLALLGGVAFANPLGSHGNQLNSEAYQTQQNPPKIEPTQTVMPTVQPTSIPAKDSTLTYRLSKINFSEGVALALYNSSRGTKIEAEFLNASDFYKLQLAEVDDITNQVKLVLPDTTQRQYLVSEDVADNLAREFEKTGLSMYSMSLGSLMSLKESGQMQKVAELLSGSSVYRSGQPQLLKENAENQYVLDLLSSAREFIFLSKKQGREYTPFTIVHPSGAYEFRIGSERHELIFSELIKMNVK